MASTKLIRKAQKNIARANNRKAEIKRLLTAPVVKKVDIEELKASFKTVKKPAKKATKKAEEPVVKKEEVKAESAE